MTLKEQIVQLSGDIPTFKVPKTLREEIIYLAEERMCEEIGDEYVDDYEVEMPKGMKIDGENVYFNKVMVGSMPLRGEAIFNCKKDCPKEVLDFFKESGYIIKEH